MKIVNNDFEKAYDKKSHSKLSVISDSLGIGGRILSWVTDFLNGRTQQVWVDGKLPGRCHVPIKCPRYCSEPHPFNVC